MNTFSGAYQNSRESVLNEKKLVIERQKNDIVNAIKKEYGVSSFNSLTESEKKSFKSLILEMWNAESGLTRKGEKFLLESKTVLTADSTDEQIEKYFKREAFAAVKDKVAGNISQGRLEEILKSIKASMDEMHKSKISTKSIKEWLLRLICEENARMIRSFKLN